MLKKIMSWMKTSPYRNTHTDELIAITSSAMLSGARDIADTIKQVADPIKKEKGQPAIPELSQIWAAAQFWILELSQFYNLMTRQMDLSERPLTETILNDLVGRGIAYFAQRTHEAGGRADWVEHTGPRRIESITAEYVTTRLKLFLRLPLMREDKRMSPKYKQDAALTWIFWDVLEEYDYEADPIATAMLFQLWLDMHLARLKVHKITIEKIIKFESR